MAALDTQRIGAVLAGAWAGLILAVAFVGTPAGFALVPREQAGQLAGFMLSREAAASVVLSAVLFVIARQQARQAARARRGSVMSANVLLVLGALFCTVLGHYGLRSAMDAARAGQGAWSFGALHGLSVAFFGLKALLVLTLAWRLAAPRTAVA